MNDLERLKKEKDGLDVFQDILRYARTGYESIPPEDLSRLRWYGLYEQRPKNGHFMLRVKIPGGVLTSPQMRTLGEIAQQYARGFADITTRQDVQFHWLTIEDIPEVFDRLHRTGLTTVGACGDVPRNVTGCPVAGLDPKEILDARPYVAAVTQYFLGNRMFSNLPRKFKISVAGCSIRCERPEINDVGAVAVQRKKVHGDVEYGFHLWVGGGLSSQPRFAQKLNMFIPTDRLVDVIRAVAEIFRDFGNRENRRRARLKFLIEDWGIERFEQQVRSRLDWSPEPAFGEEESNPTNSDHLGVHPQKQSRQNWIGIPILAGRIRAEQMLEVASLAEHSGQGELRTTHQQNLLIPHIPTEKVDSTLKELERMGLSPARSPFRQAGVTCTGKEFCNLAITETKQSFQELVEHLETRVPMTETIRIHMNGCPNSCGQHHVGDIGLQGCLVAVNGGKTEGYDILLGGRLGKKARFARPIRRKVPVSEVKYFLERLLKNYLALRNGHETFSDFVDRYTDEELARLMERESA